MKFSLIICTYKRPEALMKLLKTVQDQKLAPDETIVIDGSPDTNTKELLSLKDYTDINYFYVEEEDRGLTRQRNFGISKLRSEAEVVCFLDDDVLLTPEYFQNLMKTYIDFPNAIGVGGHILNEVEWQRNTDPAASDEFCMDGFKRKLGSRNLLRKRLGLLSDQSPGIMPEFSNGLSTGFLPPSGKVYPVDFFMGGVSSYKKVLFQKICFSEYFKGYGLYEDMDFCLRASKNGQLLVNTAAQLYHYHQTQGRPNQYQYGKMVMKNGWYVWRVKNAQPSFKNRIKWHAIAFLLTLVRLGNIINTSEKKEAFTESLGRIVGWWSLWINKPKE